MLIIIIIHIIYMLAIAGKLNAYTKLARIFEKIQNLMFF